MLSQWASRPIFIKHFISLQRALRPFYRALRALLSRAAGPFLVTNITLWCGATGPFYKGLRPIFLKQMNFFYQALQRAIGPLLPWAKGPMGHIYNAQLYPITGPQAPFTIGPGAQ